MRKSTNATKEPDIVENYRPYTFTEACAIAVERSETYGCTVHVNAVLSKALDETGSVVRGYQIDDWYDGSTVRTYTDGKIHE
jgi:hypothetical protein